MSSSPGPHHVGRVAVVVGATRGAGRAAALRLAGGGYSVVVNYAHDSLAAEATVDAVLGDGGAAVAVRADVKDELDVERLFEESRSAFGGVDVVVIAIVGAISRRSISDVTLGELDGLWRHTTRATFTVMREAVRHIRDGGSIVSLTSVLVTRPRATYGAYVAALSGTDMVTRVAALEFADRDITVNAVAFGVDVPCEPDPIADTVEYLVSPEGHAITGQVIRVNGPVWGGHEPGTNGSAHKEDAF